MNLTDSDIRRFWDKVAPPDAEGCMFWLGTQDRAGYAKFSYRRNGRRALVTASRVSCWLAYGPPPGEGYQAAHECRHRHCVAPGCLSWKTTKDNAQDRIRHGTQHNGWPR